MTTDTLTRPSYAASIIEHGPNGLTAIRLDYFETREAFKTYLDGELRWGRRFDLNTITWNGSDLAYDALIEVKPARRRRFTLR